MKQEISPSDVPMQNEDTAARVIGDVVYVVNPVTSELHGFNEVGSHIYELIDGGRTVAEIAATLSEEYDVERAALEDDVKQFLTALQELGLVGWREQP